MLENTLNEQSRVVAPGFTLIETVVTLAVIAIISGISVAFLKTYHPDAILTETIHTLESNLRFASELSSATQLPHAIRFNTIENSYALIKVGPPETTIKTVMLDSTLSLESIIFPDNTITFNLLGGAVATGTLTLRHNTNSTKTVEVRPSGYVRIQ